MQLDYKRLIKFDLLKKFEAKLEPGGNFDDKLIRKYLDMMRIINDINSIDTFIKETPSFPGSTEKIIRSEMNSIIGSTLSIEGINLSHDEIEESFRKADSNQTLQRKEQEAQNSRNVYMFIVRDIVNTQDNPFVFSDALIKQIHKYFTENMNYIGNVPGDYRGEYVSTFGDPRRTSLCRNRAEVETAMSGFIDWLNEDKNGLLSQYPLIKAIMAHYYLTEIHPFGDGNGRTARALEALIIYINVKNQYSFWSLANFWSANRNQYIDMLGRLRGTCDPLDFIEWGLKGYLTEVTRIKEKVLKKLKELMLLDYSRYLLNNKSSQKIKINQRILNIMEFLIATGPVNFQNFLSTPQVKALYAKVSRSTTSRDFTKLYNLKLIAYENTGDELYIKPNFSVLDTVTYRSE